MSRPSNNDEEGMTGVAPASSESEAGPPILLATDLRKSYDGSTPALRGLSFSLAAGRVLGFLGPNGAGKTTAIRILTTILEPSSGHFTVDGSSSGKPQEIRRKVGVLPESLGFPKRMTGIEYLTFFGQLYGQSASQARFRGRTLLEEVRLKEKSRAMIGTYSRGMRQRLGIARALINDPVVVFLDEPTLGLDPRGQKELLSMIRRIARERHAGIILCSHLLSEVESVCDDVIILREGEVVAAGSVAEVIERARQNAIRVRVPVALAAEARQLLEKLPIVAQVRPGGETIDWLEVRLTEATVKDAAGTAQVSPLILNALTEAGIPVISFEFVGGRLQDVFFEVTEESLE